VPLLTFTGFWLLRVMFFFRVHVEKFYQLSDAEEVFLLEEPELPESFELASDLDDLDGLESELLPSEGLSALAAFLYESLR
jgi:hypothetical protein